MKKWLMLYPVLMVSGLMTIAQQQREKFANLLNLQQSFTTTHVIQTNAMVFSDQGAWHGYALPGKAAEYGGFTGPVLFDATGLVLSESFARLSLTVNGKPFSFRQPALNYYPGLLQQQYAAHNLLVDQQLIFTNKRTALIKIVIKNPSGSTQNIGIQLQGSFKAKGFTLHAEAGTVTLASSGGKFSSVIISDKRFSTVTTDTSYLSVADSPVMLAPATTWTCYISQVHTLNTDNAAAFKTPSVTTAGKAFEENKIRWNNYINRILQHKTEWLKDASYQRLAIKSLITLMSNWRSAAGDIHHDGIFPSYNFFDGFWAWDSWKHAAACALFDVNLAENNIRSMFDYQDKEGMVADCIFSDSSRNNYRNTKPPLATWAVWEVYQRSKNTSFLKEMYPKLVTYHQWWYTNRDHDGNGLCEFGSTNGELIAAAWESGMDNAVRFDSAVMLSNSSHAWSVNQESVDLNSFLYLEKILLEKIASQLGYQKEATIYKEQALQLKEKINTLMYHPATGFYYDIHLTGKKPLLLQGPEGWQPLWSGVASKEQAKNVIAIIMDTNRFNTHLPFPTFQADHPWFDAKAYWRGPVWIDQAMFAIEGLRKYGYKQTAGEMLQKLLQHGEGIVDNSPLRETYNPLTGEGMTVPNFGWTAACLLRMICLDN